MRRAGHDRAFANRLRVRVTELEIDSKAIFTGAVTHEILAELYAAKKRLAELEKQPHPKG